MSTYLFLALYVSIFLELLYKDVIRFKEGNYKPYSNEGYKKEPAWKSFSRAVIVVMGTQIFVPADKFILFLTVNLAIFAFLIVQSLALSYLTYKKTEDKNIITRALIGNGILIVLILFVINIFNIFS